MTNSRTTPSIFSVNLLFLISMLLVLVLGGLLQAWHFVWGLMLTELLLILLPAVLYLRLGGVSLEEGLRLRPIRPWMALLCLLLGFSTFQFSILIDSLMVQLTGLPGVPLAAEALPQGALEGIGFFLALAVFAPVAEEALFRGVIQGVYERRRPARFAITVTALLFAIYHARLSGLPGLLPVAFILGLVAWRSRSITGSILVHAGMNATSALHTLLYLNTGQGLPFLGLPAAAGGLLATAVFLVLIWRLPPAPEPAAAPEQDTRPRLWTYAPLAAAGLLYVGVAGAGALLSAASGQTPLAEVDYAPLNIQRAVESHYRVSNQAGEPVGQMDCTLTPQDATLHLDCTRRVRAYEVQTAGGYFQDGTHQASWSVTWDRNSMALLDYHFERSYEEADWNFSARLEAGKLLTQTPEETQTLALTPDVLLEYEWAWRVNALRPQSVTAIQAPFCYLNRWEAAAGKSGPQLAEVTLRLSPAAEIDLPAGRMPAAEVRFDGQAAWYNSEHNGPVRFEDGMLIYELEG